MNETFYDILFVAGPGAFSNASLLDELLDGIFKNPLAPFETMDLKGKYLFKDKADKVKAMEILQKKGDQSVDLRTNVPYKLTVSLTKNNINCTVYMTFNSAYLNNKAIILSFRDYLDSIWNLLQEKEYAAANAYTEYKDTLLQAGISQVSGIFNFHVGWLHWLSPKAYLDRYSKEDLMAAPFYKTKEMPDGSLFLQSYNDPKDYLQSGTLEIIRTLSNYLLIKRKAIN